jgi:hypothetical protein
VGVELRTGATVTDRRELVELGTLLA